MFHSRELLSFLLCAFLAPFTAAQEMHMAARTTPAFDQLKALVGQWEGTTQDGKKAQVSYELISGGSVLMERLSPGNEPGMITMYSLESDRILVTHYCSAGNQPTMQTAPSPAASGKLDFTFLRLAGAKSPDEAHMVGLTLSMPDKNRLVQTWTFDDHGKAMTEVITLTRKS
ncbi:MAG TPA: hypothetical protein VJX70_07895 [Candidatus Acidoferrum sp.]|nr:hypothetical protein [Candidatus Acidoferrum sp.]